MAFKDISEALTGFDFDNVVVFDTETTGLQPYYGDEVVSISICDAYGNDLFSSLIKPRKKRTWPEAEAINGISPAMVKNAPTLNEVADNIRRCLCTGKLIVGYNVSFDVDFLREAGVITYYPETFDVMREYAQIHGTQLSKFGSKYRYSKLSVCASSYGYSFSAHDSKEDAKATAYCFRALLNDESYVNTKLPSLKEKLTPQSMSQTKATTSNISKLIADGTMSSNNALLKTGAVTRGKNKGVARYECFIGDQCVGVGRPNDRQNIANLLFTDNENLPDHVKCSVVLSKSESSAYCECTVTEGTVTFNRHLREMAKTYRENNDCEWRKIEVESNSKEFIQPDNTEHNEQASKIAQGFTAVRTDIEEEKIARNRSINAKLLRVILVVMAIVLLFINVPLAILFGVIAYLVGRRPKK